MSAQCEVTAKRAAGSSMSLFERYLTVWVDLCIVVGIALATVVGVLVEVPVMLSVVKIVNATRDWYERGAMRTNTCEEDK